ncbi:MAG TPA: carboxypeptidase regulatory-like domain-containing protein [Acidobacteriota bacterium]|nr:carboxypeptidase regulatory-like domain-containing protein [Acidobacteriota bacterium]
MQRRRKSRQVLLMASLIATLLSFCTSIAYSQGHLGTILGTVRDGTGAVVPGAEVQVTNILTGLKRNSITDDQGNYSIPALQVGDYTVSTSMPGFKTATSSVFHLYVGETRRVDLHLEIGETTTEVTVHAGLTNVQTEGPTRTFLITSAEVVDLPLNGRNFQQLLQLAPGAELGGAMSGARNTLQSYVLEGANFTETYTHRPTTKPSIDAIQEFSFEQSMAPAKFGQGAGGVVNMSLKSGTNEWHGTLFEFHRNDAFNARNFFSASKPPALKQHQFGVVVSGPVFRDRSFIMFNYEGYRSRAASVATSNVPTDLERAGNFSEKGPVYDPFAPLTADGKRQRFPGDIIPENRWDPFSKALIQYWPKPNYTHPTGAANYLNDSPGKDKTNQYNVRFDQHLSADNQVAVNVVTTFTDDFKPGNFPVVSDWLSIERGILANIQYRHVFNPSFISQTNLAYTRRRDYWEQFSKEPIASSLGVPVQSSANDGYPLVGVSLMGSLNANNSTLPWGTSNNNWELRQDFTRIMGNHSLSFGGALNTIAYNQLITSSSRGRVSYSGRYTSETPGTLNSQVGGWGDFLLGAPERLEMDVGSTPFYARRKAFHLYFQDDWKVTPNLTLNIGLRNEITMPWKERHRGAAFFDPTCACLTYMTGAPLPEGFDPPYPYRTDGPTGFGETHFKNLAPRIGFAWSPWGKGKTVLRGGYGIFYDSAIGGAVGVMGNAPPFRGSLRNDADLNAPNLRAPLDYPDFRFIKPGQTQPFGLDPTWFPDPYVQQWNLTVEQLLPWEILASVGYVGSTGIHLLDNRWPNIAEPGPGDYRERIPYPAFGAQVQLITPSGTSSYHGLQMSAVKRLSHGLFYNFAYTFAKSLDLRSHDTTWTDQQDPKNVAANRGRSSFDIRHRFSMGFDYNLPFGRGRTFMANAPKLVDLIFGGWHLGGIIVGQSGYPFTVSSPTATLNIQTFWRRADRLADGALPTDQRTIYQWFDTSAFAEPAPYKYGNSGRNILDGPGYLSMDLAGRKEFYITEEHRLEFRAEAFNALNRANFNNPVAATNSPYFGSVTSAKAARVFQFALKYHF